jgi:hypothetical protein
MERATRRLDPIEVTEHTGGARIDEHPGAGLRPLLRHIAPTRNIIQTRCAKESYVDGGHLPHGSRGQRSPRQVDAGALERRARQSGRALVRGIRAPTRNRSRGAPTTRASATRSDGVASRRSYYEPCRGVDSKRPGFWGDSPRRESTATTCVMSPGLKHRAAWGVEQGCFRATAVLRVTEVDDCSAGC